MVVSCKLNGRDPFAYFNNVRRKLSTHPADRIDGLLPSNWKPPTLNAEDDSVIKDQIAKAA